MSEWKPIETAPRDVDFLATNGILLGIGSAYLHKEGYYAQAAYAYDGDTPTADYDGPISFDPTHWQPIPNPPMEQEA